MPACVGSSVYVCAGVRQGSEIKRKTAGRLKEQNCKMFALDCKGFLRLLCHYRVLVVVIHSSVNHLSMLPPLTLT